MMTPSKRMRFGEQPRQRIPDQCGYGACDHFLADAEDLNLSEEDLTARINAYEESAGLTEADLLASGLTNEDFRQSFLYEDVMNFLVENAKRE